MSIEAVAKIFVICQPEKVLILPKRSEILRLHCLLSRYPDRKRAN